MAKGRYIKAAERACAGKARYDSAIEAEQASDWRLRAYRCPVCHHFHLTSRDASSTTSPIQRVAPKDVSGPKLSDLDWGAALDPQPREKAARPPKRVKPRLPEPPPFRLARCVSSAGADSRVRLVIDGVLVKSASIKVKALRASLVEGVIVRVSLDNPPIVMGLAP